MIDWKRLGRLVHRQRREERLTIRELAEELQLSHATVWRVEMGKAVETRAYLLLCRWLDIDTFLFLK